MWIANIVLGGIVLLFGRKLFWAFVAIVGFLVGVELAPELFPDLSTTLQVVLGLVLGLVGAIVAIVAQRIGFAIAGFFAVGYLSMAAGEALQPGSSGAMWFVIGGVIGALVAALIMDHAIIILSSLVGAAAIVSSLTLAPAVSLIVLIVIAAVGISFQTRSLVQSRRQSYPHAD